MIKAYSEQQLYFEQYIRAVQRQVFEERLEEKWMSDVHTYILEMLKEYRDLVGASTYEEFMAARRFVMWMTGLNEQELAKLMEDEE